ncbi:MAG: LON peptidase substrate-binding domain-containing protein [Planctomycetaceae bacterium]|jgi:Lon protease-like protein|nr:LON peptidase substrate-binding domain-containing protein [Planctomycetaceae bacterium]
MGNWEKLGLPTDFDGIVRLFPLPNLVMFPHVIQALHIFEPRYCEMLSEALESDHLITMAVLEPGWESHYELVPKLSKFVCIGRVVSHTPVGDGRHNILLAGIQRARIIEELTEDVQFRKARVEIIEDIPMEDPVAQEAARLELLKLFRPALPEDLAQSDAFSDLLSQHIPLGSLTDVIAYAINFPQAIKQVLLGEHRVQVRYQILAEQLVHWANTSKSNTLANEKPIRSFDGNPPPFSVN